MAQKEFVMEGNYIIHERLKENVSRVNPYSTEMPAAGDHLVVYNALCAAFFQMKVAFSGNVEQFVQLGIENGLQESDLRTGFKNLVRYGYLLIENGVFKPTKQFLNKLF